MGMAAILVVCYRRNISTFFPSLLEGSILNVNEIGPVVSEEKPFENVDKQLICDLWPRSQNNLELQNFKGVETEFNIYQRAQWQPKTALVQLFPT